MKNLPRGKIYPSRKSRRKGPKERRAKRKSGLQRYFQRFRRRFSRYAVLFFILIILGIGVYTIFFSPLFMISSVEVTVTPNGVGLEEASLRQEVKKRVSGNNLFLLKERQLSFLGDDLSIEGFEIGKEWPDTLKVRVKKRSAQAVLEDGIGRLFLVDEEGVVFSRARCSHLPLIKYSGARLSLGDRVADWEISFVLRALSGISSKGLLVESVRVGTDAHLKIVDGPEVILPLNDGGVVDQMVEIINSFESRGETVKKIDLRYKNPVIEY